MYTNVQNVNFASQIPCKAVSLNSPEYSLLCHRPVDVHVDVHAVLRLHLKVGDPTALQRVRHKHQKTSKHLELMDTVLEKQLLIIGQSAFNFHHLIKQLLLDIFCPLLPEFCVFATKL